MSKITTHVLDNVTGRPAAGIFVRLFRFLGGWVGEGAGRILSGEWIEVSSGVTDSEGRCSNLRSDAEAGIYRITFEAGAYFSQRNRVTIYPEISVTFDCDGASHYHLPLLLSDNSYTAYRGS